MSASNLAAWLDEQIAEDADRDRRVARLARAMYESFQGHNPYPWDEQRQDVHAEYLDAAAVIVDREMSGVLAECEAKRRIIALHADGGESQGYTNSGYGRHAQACTTCGTHGEYGTPWPCDTIKLLAGPFADRPGYREEWMP